MPIDVKKAVQLAREYLSEVLQVPISELLLEEVELSGDQQFWSITLSYPAPSRSPIEVALGQGGRAYKIVRLEADTGKFMSIKIRSLVSV